MKNPIALPVSGCATNSRDIATSYASPIQYQSYDCEQLASEAQRLQARTNQLGGRLDEAEYARMKGEYNAIQQTAVAKKCSALVAQTTPPAPITVQ